MANTHQKSNQTFPGKSSDFEKVQVRASQQNGAMRYVATVKK